MVENISLAVATAVTRLLQELSMVTAPHSIISTVTYMFIENSTKKDQ